MQASLTKGPILKTLLSFTLPFLLASFLQTFYGMADLLIVGQFCDPSIVSAVSIGSQFMHLLTVVLAGLSVGITIKISHFIGQNDTNPIGKLINSSLIGYGLFSCLILVCLLSLIDPLLFMIQTPAQSLQRCKEYLLICFLGLPFITGYNCLSSSFRGLGDSKSPLYFVFLGIVMNLFLDWIFIGVFHWNAFGAAFATVVSQGVSFSSAYIILQKRKFSFKIPFSFKLFEWSAILQVLKLGFPIALQDGIIQIAFMVITIIANTRGLIFSTGVGITEKVISFLFLVPSAFLASLSPLIAQNIGANLSKRAKSMLHLSLLICIGYGIICFIICQFFSAQIISLLSKTQKLFQLVEIT